MTRIGTDALVAQAERADCVLELVPLLARLFPPADRCSSFTALPSTWTRTDLRCASLKPEPTLDEDVAYGMRLLVDVAERSLSESPFQDPTTAVQAIDRLHDILRHLASRPFPDGRFPDEDGQIRLLVKMMTWEDYVHLAFDEIRMAGAGSLQASTPGRRLDGSPSRRASGAHRSARRAG